MKIYLEKYHTDTGYPDVGHDEYRLVYESKRSNRLLQRLIGSKKIYLTNYGERKPSDTEVEIDTKRFDAIAKKWHREELLKDILK